MLKNFSKIFLMIFISLALFFSFYNKIFATSQDQQLQDLINIIAENKNPEKKIDAINKLGELKSSKSITYLIDIMNNTKEKNQIRVAAVRALGKTGDIRAIDPIINLWRQIEVMFLFAMGEPFIEALRDIGDPVVGLLIFRLKNGDRNARSEAAYLLGRIGAPRAVEPLIEALYDKDQEIFNEAGCALHKIGEPAIKSLIIVLNGNNKKLKLRATMLLGGIGGKDVVEPLIGVLNNENPKVRYWAAYALSRAGDISTIKPIAKLLNDENPIVREVAAATIEVLEGKRESVPFTEIEFRHHDIDTGGKPFPTD